MHMKNNMKPLQFQSGKMVMKSNQTILYSTNQAKTPEEFKKIG